VYIYIRTSPGASRGDTGKAAKISSILFREAIVLSDQGLTSWGSWSFGVTPRQNVAGYCEANVLARLTVAAVGHILRGLEVTIR
jgi:hypothetical protein